MLSLSINFYVRLFVRVYTSPAVVRDAASKQMYVFQSQGCDSFFMQRVGRKVRPTPRLCPSLILPRLEPDLRRCIPLSSSPLLI